MGKGCLRLLGKSAEHFLPNMRTRQRTAPRQEQFRARPLRLHRKETAHEWQTQEERARVAGRASGRAHEYVQVCRAQQGLHDRQDGRVASDAQEAALGSCDALHLVQEALHEFSVRGALQRKRVPRAVGLLQRVWAKGGHPLDEGIRVRLEPGHLARGDRALQHNEPVPCEPRTQPRRRFVGLRRCRGGGLRAQVRDDGVEPMG